MKLWWYNFDDKSECLLVAKRWRVIGISGIVIVDDGFVRMKMCCGVSGGKVGVGC